MTNGIESSFLLPLEIFRNAISGLSPDVENEIDFD